VRDDGGKKEQGCNNRHAPDYASAPVRMRRPEMPRERERNQQSAFSNVCCAPNC
jgi:hypothetical protein